MSPFDFRRRNAAPGKPLELRNFEEPELEPGAILLKTLGSEVCGTDTHL